MKDHAMPNNQNSKPIGEPTPIDRQTGRHLLVKVGMVAGVTASGLLAFALMQKPTYCRGATRSAMLQWQHRQAEIEQTISGSISAETNTAPVHQPAIELLPR